MVAIVVPLKHLRNFWRTLDILLINREINLILTWSENCILTVSAQGDNPARLVINAPTGATFKVTDTKLYVPVVTLSTEDDNKLLEQLKQDLKGKLNRINIGQK